MLYAGIICTLTASADEYPTAPEQNTTQTQTLSKDASLEEIFFFECYDNADELEQILLDYGIPITDCSPPTPIEDTGTEYKQSGATKVSSIDSFPTKGHNLPFGSRFYDIPIGWGSFTEYYFDPSDDNIFLLCDLSASTTNDYTQKVVDANLFRQRKSWVGSNTWESCGHREIRFTHDVGVRCDFNGLSNEFVYCLKFINISEKTSPLDTGIDGIVVISDFEP